ncbi:MAG: TrmB family transcriptional regulator [archaeon]
MLEKSGLSKLQSTVYLALLDLQEATVKEIAIITKIDRSNVYKILCQLLESELIFKKIERPTTYVPIKITNVASILIDKRKNDLENARKNMRELIDISKKCRTQLQPEGRDFFRLYPSGSKTFNREWEKALKTAKVTIDVICTEKREPNDDPIWEIYDELLTKGVNVRWILDRSTKDDNEFDLRVKQFEHLFKHNKIKMKTSFNTLQPCGCMVDRKMVVIFLDDHPPLKGSRTLWTNNNQIVLNFIEHFELNWKKSKEYTVNNFISNNSC